MAGKRSYVLCLPGTHTTNGLRRYACMSYFRVFSSFINNYNLNGLFFDYYFMLFE